MRNTNQKITYIRLPKGEYLYRDLYIYKYGEIVQIFMNGISNLPYAQYAILATLPEGYRPALNLSWTYRHVDNRAYRISINTNGEIIGYNYATEETMTNAVQTIVFIAS